MVFPMTQGRHLAEEHAAWAEGAPAPLRLSDAEFDALVDAGMTAQLGRVELRGGELWRMNPVDLPHARMRRALARQLETAAANVGLDVVDEVGVYFQGYVPVPDIVIFAQSRPARKLAGADVRLIVEVSDTTLDDDLGDKRARYAAARLGEYWVVDMKARRILRFHAPAGDAFTEAPAVAAGARCESVTLAGVAIETAGLPWGDEAA